MSCRISRKNHLIALRVKLLLLRTHQPFFFFPTGAAPPTTPDIAAGKFSGRLVIPWSGRLFCLPTSSTLQIFCLPCVLGIAVWPQGSLTLFLSSSWFCPWRVQPADLKGSGQAHPVPFLEPLNCCISFKILGSFLIAASTGFLLLSSPSLARLIQEKYNNTTNISSRHSCFPHLSK